MPERVGDEIIPDGLKAQRSRAEIGSPVTLVRKLHKLADGLEDVFTEARGSDRIVVGDELPFTLMSCAAPG